METTATSIASTATMIAPKRAVMIADPTRAIVDVADPGTAAIAHPSQATCGECEHARRTNSLSVNPAVPERAPVTCSTCHMTYLPSAIPSPSASSEDWLCDGCQRNLR